MIDFTIFTGTYNSEPIIDRVFQSITSQTYREFEWIVIDDCSKDDTVSKIESFKAENPELLIRVVQHVKNTGVARSRMEALQLANGKYFVTWDHDDIQNSKQLEVFHGLWEANESKQIGNIFAKMTDQNDKILGILFPKEPYISNYIEVHNTHLIGNSSKGNVVEHHVCSKTEKYKEVLTYYERHPKLLLGRLPNGGDVWGMMAFLGYDTIYTNVPVRTYFINEPGRASMSTAKRKDNPERIWCNKLLWVNYFDKKLSNKYWKFKMRNLFAVTMYGFLAKKNVNEISQAVSNGTDKLFIYLFQIPAKKMAERFSKE